MAKSNITLMAYLFGICFVVMTSSFVVAQDAQLFSALYDATLDIVAPSSSQTGVPSQVLLFEMPGIPINRAEWDPAVWAANNYQDRQPDAVQATFVDRLPFYYGPTFADSGSKISTFWKNFIYQYIVPVVVNPEQELKVAAQRPLLANGTLSDAYQTRLDDYEATLSGIDNLRDDCLAKSSPAICSRRSVVWNERLKRKWFSLEVARRDLASIESTMLALQVQDLKNIFADALEQFATNERVDVGVAGLGQTYYVTYLSPSSFWRWWPQNVGAYDYSVPAGRTSVSWVFNQINATVSVPPAHGDFSYVGTTFTYFPVSTFTGFDRVGFTYATAAGVSTFKSFTIRVVGNDVTFTDSAFTTVTVSSSTSSSTAARTSSYASTYSSASSSSASSSNNPNWYWWWYSGSSSSSSSSGSSSSSSTSSYASSQSFSQTGSQSTISFDLARVNINRPWLDTSLLQYSPVAVRGIARNGWSDGTILPQKNTVFQFKLLPVAFLVSRNIKISNTIWASSMSSLASSLSSSSSAYQYGSSSRASVGPWFIGSSSSSHSDSSSSGRNYQESSSFTTSTSSSTGGTLSIQGPQVIAWLCTPIPAFPTATADDVAAFEEAQLAKYTAKQAALATTVPASQLQPVL